MKAKFITASAMLWPNFNCFIISRQYGTKFIINCYPINVYTDTHSVVLVYASGRVIEWYWGEFYFANDAIVVRFIPSTIEPATNGILAMGLKVYMHWTYISLEILWGLCALYVMLSKRDWSDQFVVLFSVSVMMALNAWFTYDIRLPCD